MKFWISTRIFTSFAKRVIFRVMPMVDIGGGPSETRDCLKFEILRQEY